MKGLRARLSPRRAAMEAEIRAEIESHVAQRAAELEAEGMAPDAARRAALRRFGNVDRIVRAGVRERRGTPLERLRRRGIGRDTVGDLLQDVRFGYRMMAKHPGATVLSIVSLALAIGFNTTVFSLVDAVMLAPLGVASPDRLVRVVRTGDEIGDAFMSYPDVRDVRDAARTLTDVGAFVSTTAPTTHDDGVELLFGESITPNLFDLLGVAPAIGRTFTEDENVSAGAHFVAMISESLWQRRYGGTTDVLGRDLVIAGRPFTIVGVAPGSYAGGAPPIRVDFWVPMAMDTLLSGESGGTGRIDRRGSHSLGTVGRLAPGATIEQARSEMAAIGEALTEVHPDTNADVTLDALPYGDVRIDPALDRMMMPIAGVLMGLVGLVLLIACANVANLLLARASTRSQEVAVRRALGASGARLARQLLTESVLLALCGGALGALLASVAIRALLAIETPLTIPMSFDVGVNLRVLGFTALVATATGIVFGVLPALRGARLDVGEVMKHDGRAASGASGGWLRSGLVAVQVSVSLVLLIAAALLTRSLWNARSIETGIAERGVVALSLELGLQGYGTEDARQLVSQALERIESLPGVERAAYTERLPLDSTTATTSRVRIEDPPLPAGEELPSVDSTVVTPDYFATVSIPITAGRGFDARDTVDAPGVIVVNRELADRFWPGESAIGKRVSFQGPRGPFAEVVGIHASHKIRTLGEDARPHFYAPYSQYLGSGLGALVARTEGEAGPTLDAMRRVVRELDPNVAIFSAVTMEQHLSRSLYLVRMGAWALLALGAIGAVLAAAGVYGVVSFAVARRTREIGVRMAIGADRRRVERLVVAQGMRAAVAGLVLGVLISLLATRVLGALLYGVASTDLVAFAGATLALGAVAVIANLAPARRAARVHPVRALRAE